MLNHICNHTYNLGFSSHNLQNASFLASKVDNVFRPEILDYSNTYQIICSTYEWSLIVIASYFRYIIYKYWFKQYKKNNLTSIDILMFFWIISRHLNMLVYMISRMCIVFNDTTLVKVTGTWFTTASAILYRFDANYYFVGNFGIALYRIMLIKHDTLVEHRIGSTRLFFIILFGGLLISSCFTVLLHVNDYNHLFIVEGVQAPRRSLLEILDEYEQSRGNNSIYSLYALMRKCVGLLSFFMTVSSIIIYVDFFHFAYKHDNNERLKHLLEPEVIRKRNKQNAITFFGQVCSFIFQMTILISGTLAIQMHTFENQFTEIFLILRTTVFACSAILEVLISKNLRSLLFT